MVTKCLFADGVGVCSFYDSAFDRAADQGGDNVRPESLADLGERAFFLTTLGAYVVG